MSQGTNTITSTILLIEADTSLRRLISLGLRHRGLRVIEASAFSSETTEDIRSLDLLVLDMGKGSKTDWGLLEQLRVHPYFSTLPIVVLAWEWAGRETENEQTRVSYLSKPFDARALHDTIDQLLAENAASKAAAEAGAEEMLLATYTQHTSPSIWPIVTAAGVLITVIGMMIQLAIAAIGLLIVMAALLLWTLDIKPEQPPHTRSFTPCLDRDRI